MAEDTSGRSTRRSTSSGSGDTAKSSGSGSGDTAKSSGSGSGGDAAAAKGDIEERWAEVLEQGYLGTSVDPHDNAEYTLETGPDSPGGVPDEHSRVELPQAGGDTAK